MTLKQVIKVEQLKKQHGKPDSISTFMDVVFLAYSFGIIGIEQDGYSHM